MNRFKRFIIKALFPVIVFLSMNVYSLPCFVAEQEDRRLQNVCDNNIFNSSKVNLSSSNDFQSYRADCRAFFSRHPAKLETIERVVVVRSVDLPNIGKLLSGGEVNPGGRRFIERQEGSGYPIGTLILFPEGMSSIHLERNIRLQSKSALYHRADSKAERVRVTHAENFDYTSTRNRNLMSYSSGSFTIDGFDFTKAPGFEGNEILAGNPSNGITLKNIGFNRGGVDDQVSVLLKPTGSGVIEISGVDIDCSSNSRDNFYCVRVECGGSRQNCPDASVTINDLDVTQSTDPENDMSTDPSRALSFSGINRFVVNNVRVAANSTDRPVSFQFNDHATNVVGCISGIIIDSAIRGPKIHIGASDPGVTEGTIGFFGNGFLADEGSGMGPLEFASYRDGFVAGDDDFEDRQSKYKKTGLTYVDRAVDCFYRPEPTSATVPGCSSTPSMRDVLTTNLVSTIEASSQPSIMSTINAKMMSANATDIPGSSTVLATLDVSTIKPDIKNQLATTTPMIITSSELAEPGPTMVLPDSRSEVFEATDSVFSDIMPTTTAVPLSHSSTNALSDSDGLYSHRGSSLDMTGLPSVSRSFPGRNPTALMPGQGNSDFKYYLTAGIGSLVVATIVVVTAVGIRIAYVKGRSETYVVNPDLAPK